MTKEEKREFLKLIKQGTLEVLESTDGQLAFVEALKSSGGQLAITEALKSKTGKEAFAENFVEVFQDTLLPSLNRMTEDISKLKETAVKKEEFTKMLKEKLLKGVQS